LTGTRKTGTAWRMQSDTSKAVAALAFTVCVWGMTPVFVRGVSLALGPYDALVIRLFLSGIIYAAITAALSNFSFPRADVPKLLMVTLPGLLGYYAGTIFGFAYAPAGVGTLIMASQPLLIGLFAWLAGAERLTPATLCGLAVAFTGSVLLIWGDDLGVAAAQKTDLLIGVGFIFLASLGWAFYVVYSRALVARHGAIKITGISNVLIALPMIPFLRTDMVSKLANMPVDAKLGLGILFTFGTVSVITWNYAGPRLKPTMLGMSLYVVPVVAVFAGWLILSETITGQIIIAAAVILLGVAISQLTTFTRRSAKATT
jgi:drug/metabolite transporter (DMT)-like permease